MLFTSISVKLLTLSLTQIGSWPFSSSFFFLLKITCNISPRNQTRDTRKYRSIFYTVETESISKELQKLAKNTCVIHTILIIFVPKIGDVLNKFYIWNTKYNFIWLEWISSELVSQNHNNNQYCFHVNFQFEIYSFETCKQSSAKIRLKIWP